MIVIPSQVKYTALRRLVPPHVSGSEQVALIEFSRVTRKRQVRKTTKRSLAGVTETIYDGGDTYWVVDFAPASAHRMDIIREFLHSTSGGEPFWIWPYGSESAPLYLRRTDTGFEQQPFMRRAASDSDVWKVSITGIEQ